MQDPSQRMVQCTAQCTMQCTVQCTAQRTRQCVLECTLECTPLAAWPLPHQMLGGVPPMEVLASLQPAAPLYLEPKQLREAVAQEGL